MKKNNIRGYGIIKKIIKVFFILFILFAILVIFSVIIENKKKNETNKIETEIVDDQSTNKEGKIKDSPKTIPIKKPEKIVQTEIPQKYGVNVDALVSVINTNAFVIEILKDYKKINLKINDTASSKFINLKVDLKDGKITLVKDGLYTDAGITFVAPLNATLNIINNVNNINILNFIGFALAVQTEPPQAKQEFINNIIAKGKK